MTRDPVCFPAIVSVGEVFDALKKGKHHSFPVSGVDSQGSLNGILLGTIARKVALNTIYKINLYLTIVSIYLIVSIC
jgi:hypothetical protein